MRMLNEYDVMLEGILLKPNMILPGLDAPPASPADVEPTMEDAFIALIQSEQEA